MVTHYRNDSSIGEWLREMIAMESEGEQPPMTYEGKPLRRIGDVYVTEETAAEILGVAA